MKVRPKRKAWKWVVSGVVVALLAVVAVVSLLIPSKPFDFLKGASLIQVELIDYSAMFGGLGMPPGTPTSVTVRIYGVGPSTKELTPKFREELTSAGFLEHETLYRGYETYIYEKGASESVYITSANNCFDFGLSPMHVNGQTLVVVMSETRFFDKLLDKMHKDKRPTGYTDPSGVFKTRGSTGSMP
jgi:hypothetical protein